MFCGAVMTSQQTIRIYVRSQSARLLEKFHKNGLFEDVRGMKYDREELTDSSNRLYRFDAFFTWDLRVSVLCVNGLIIQMCTETTTNVWVFYLMSVDPRCLATIQYKSNGPYCNLIVITS